MSPEERAMDWLMAQGIYKPQLYVEELASAIRAAENDALERAARHIEAISGAERVTKRECAWQVRLLKSKPPEGK